MHPLIHYLFCIPPDSRTPRPLEHIWIHPGSPSPLLFFPASRVCRVSTGLCFTFTPSYLSCPLQIRLCSSTHPSFLALLRPDRIAISAPRRAAPRPSSAQVFSRAGDEKKRASSLVTFLVPDSSLPSTVTRESDSELELELTYLQIDGADTDRDGLLCSSVKVV